MDISMYPSDTMKFMQNFVNETRKVRLEDKQEVKDNKILFQIQKKILSLVTNSLYKVLFRYLMNFVCFELWLAFNLGNFSENWECHLNNTALTNVISWWQKGTVSEMPRNQYLTLNVISYLFLFWVFGILVHNHIKPSNELQKQQSMSMEYWLRLCQGNNRCMYRIFF